MPTCIARRDWLKINASQPWSCRTVGVSLCFSYSGWSSSGCHVVLAGEPPAVDERNEGIASVRVIREMVDPVEWLQNFRSAVDFMEGEPHVDPHRIGAWGTSFGGGIALHHTANDERIKVLAVQVASLASVLKGDLAAHARQRAIDAARGTIPCLTIRLNSCAF